MEGDGGGAGARAMAWDLGVHWAPAGASAYPQHFLPQPGGPSQQQMQQELTSLKLGKRPCCLVGAGGGGEVVQGGNGVGDGGSAADQGKRKEKAAAAAAVAVPRCQVEGCHMALAGAKEYHRRHKVCDAHSKAPRVIVYGAEQRFCQQCSRFHAMSEFDDAKRSCRRRLAGHNERRRKSNANEAMARGSAHTHGVTSLVHGFPPYGALPTSPAGALSLLSSGRGADPWLIPPPDMFSARSSSAALDELIAENRAALLACHFFPDRSVGRPAPMQVPAETPGWHAHLQAQQQVQAASAGHARVHHAGNGVGRHVQDDEAPAAAAAGARAGHVTLDLMQAPAATGAAFRPMPDRATKDGDAGCSSDVWTPLEGAHVV